MYFCVYFLAISVFLIMDNGGVVGAAPKLLGHWLLFAWKTIFLQILAIFAFSFFFLKVWCSYLLLVEQQTISEKVDSVTQTRCRACLSSWWVFADKSASFMETAGNHYNLPVTKVITRRLSLQFYCNWFYNSNHQHPPTSFYKLYHGSSWTC